jgi:hypothetical protein
MGSLGRIDKSWRGVGFGLDRNRTVGFMVVEM